MKTTTLTDMQRKALEWFTGDRKRVLMAHINDEGVECFDGVQGLHTTMCARGLKKKRLIEQAGRVGDKTAYRISKKGRRVLAYNKEKRA
ncbi:hypothetical protein [Vibrio phage VP16C]|nr:hypothetical protein [Vibrio phage VP16C]